MFKIEVDRERWKKLLKEQEDYSYYGDKIENIEMFTIKEKKDKVVLSLDTESLFRKNKNINEIKEGVRDTILTLIKKDILDILNFDKKDLQKLEDELKNLDNSFKIIKLDKELSIVCEHPVYGRLSYNLVCWKENKLVHPKLWESDLKYLKTNNFDFNPSEQQIKMIVKLAKEEEILCQTAYLYSSEKGYRLIMYSLQDEVLKELIGKCQIWYNKMTSKGMERILLTFIEDELKEQIEKENPKEFAEIKKLMEKGYLLYNCQMFTLPSIKLFLKKHKIEIIGGDNLLPDFPQLKIPSNGIELKKFQQEAMSAWIENDRIGTIALPTGSGKTIIALKCIEDVDKKRILIVVPTVELVQQWKDMLMKWLKFPEDRIGTYYSQHKEIKDITIIIFQSGHRKIAEEVEDESDIEVNEEAVEEIIKLSESSAFIILDEGHHAPAPVFQKIMINVKCPYRLSLTACIGGSTKILCNDKWKEVRNLKKEQVYAVNSKYNLEKNNAVIERADWSDRYPLQITTFSGKTINLTNDHPLLSFDNKQKWKKAEEFKEGDLVATVNNIDEDEDVLYAKFLGFCLGDAHLYKEPNPSIYIVTPLEEIKAVSELLDKLQIPYHIHDRKPSAKSFGNKTPVKLLQINDRKFCRKMFKLGLIAGKKTIQKFQIPEWIKTDKNFSRAFLSGLFGAEGCSPYISKNRNTQWVNNPQLTLVTKNQDYLKDFFDDIVMLLKENNIGSNYIIRKTKEESWLFNLRVDCNQKNLIEFLHKIEFSLSPKKQLRANKILAYIVIKNKYLQEREIKRQKACKLYKEGKIITEIDEILGVHFATIYRWIIGKNKKVELRNIIIPELPVSEEVRWEIVKNVKKGIKEDIYDVRVPFLQNFIANGFVSHNTPFREDKNEGLAFLAIGDVVYKADYATLAKQKIVSPIKFEKVFIDLTEDEKKFFENKAEYTVRKRASYGMYGNSYVSGSSGRVLEEVEEETEEIYGELFFNKLKEECDIPVSERIKVAEPLLFAENKFSKLEEICNKHKDGKILVFNQRVAGTKIIKHFLEKEGFETLLLTGTTLPSKRKSIFEQFKDSNSAILITTTVLDEGIDVPDANVVVVFNGSKSKRQMIQRIGRGCRYAKGKIEYVYELVVKPTKETESDNKIIDSLVEAFRAGMVASQKYMAYWENHSYTDGIDNPIKLESRKLMLLEMAKSKYRDISDIINIAEQEELIKKVKVKNK